MVINVKVPVEYQPKKFRDAIGLGLFDLAVGERPDPDMIPMGETVTAKIKLTKKGAALWETLLPQFDNNKRRLAREALCLVSQEPEHCLQCRI